MEMMIQFDSGGPLDGQVFASDSDPELDPRKVPYLLWLIAASLDIAERKEEKPGTLLIWRQPSPRMSEQAKAEDWSKAKRRALMPYHEYHINRFEETDDLVLLTAAYQGTK